ncbi:hypothetical protein P6166_02360 [Stenotrophomonas sp. HITSZ_GD]|uniref:hypothetical protein n=1 Tax=Stenotrophomonas sp. HITSZ_GD TaxID=3037248 RepID=UPI00240E6E5C|nr:hypothetical protein [Stenotrophomonas sp. HITSZ_GD]MDG2524201.1 hypothetical protein [Stenotrophomonas sp. HITSZ_GD]
MLAQVQTQRSAPGRQRSALRKLLSDSTSADVAAITPEIVRAEQADAARRQHRVKLAFGQAPVRKANLVRGYGTEALEQLRIDFGDYVSDE